ncbi:cytochrome P450 9e2-like [Diabrotica undecimpunctata]|uniref:cytochrome P450 9e2-like n=1 Tax=Diabrotica undecimpunctata TaxID=50387 RepID=UPI003B634E03
MIEIVLVVTALAVIMYYLGVKPMQYWKNRGIKQGKPAWFFGDNLGTTLKTESFADMVVKVYNAVPGVRYSGAYQFSTPTLVIKDLELIKQIGVKDFDHFTDHRSIISEEADPLWAKNLFALTGQKWREMRPILSPSFTSSKMRAMFILISETAQAFTKNFLELDQDVMEIEMKDKFTRFTNDVIATTAFGVKIDSMKNKENDFFVMGKDITSFSGFWKSLKFLGMVFFPRLFTFLKIGMFTVRVRKFFTDLVDDTIKVREKNEIVRPDMIHLLMEARKGVHQHDEKVIDTGFAIVEESDLGKGVIKEMTNLDIAAQAMIFFFAGFDSVSSLMCFISYELAINPDIQERLRTEIEDTLKQYNGNVPYEAILKMRYLDMVVSEGLRKYPSAVAIDRICTKPYTIEPVKPDERPVYVEKDTTIWFPTYAIHRDPQYYPDPEKFDPERFNDENKAKIQPYSYIPFGVGPRNCIGSRFAILETKIVFFHLLSNYKLEPSTKTAIPLNISKSKFNLDAEGGFWFNMKRIRK